MCGIPTPSAIVAVIVDMPDAIAIGDVAIGFVRHCLFDIVRHFHCVLLLEIDRHNKG